MTIAVDTVTPRINLRTIVSSFPLSRFPLNSLAGYAGSRCTAGWHASNSLRGLRLDAGQLRSPRRHQRPVGQPGAHPAVRIVDRAGIGQRPGRDLQMGALGSRFPPPAAAVRFLSNGGDMAIVSHDLAVADAAYDAIHTAVLDGTYRRAQLDASVQKLLNLGLRFMP